MLSAGRSVPRRIVERGAAVSGFGTQSPDALQDAQQHVLHMHVSPVATPRSAGGGDACTLRALQVWLSQGCQVRPYCERGRVSPLRRFGPSGVHSAVPAWVQLYGSPEHVCCLDLWMPCGCAWVLACRSGLRPATAPPVNYHYARWICDRSATACFITHRGS